MSQPGVRLESAYSGPRVELRPPVNPSPVFRASPTKAQGSPYPVLFPCDGRDIHRIKLRLPEIDKIRYLIGQAHAGAPLCPRGLVSRCLPPAVVEALLLHQLAPLLVAQRVALPRASAATDRPSGRWASPLDPLPSSCCMARSLAFCRGPESDASRPRGIGVPLSPNSTLF